MGSLFKGDFLIGGLFEGAQKMFLVVGHITVEIFLLINNFFDATHTSNRIFFKGQAKFVN